MISMDEQKAQQVWSRVMNVSAPCPAKDGTEGAQLLYCLLQQTL